MQQTRPRAVDLFSGCGGLSLGLEQAGYRVILSVDRDPWAIETHRHNFPGAALDLDLSDPERLQSLIALLSGIPVDLVAGGPPCQPFSRAGRSKIRSLVVEGRRDANDVRRGLWEPFLEVVEAIQPKAVLLENVPDMALADDLFTLRTIMTRLDAVGYDTYPALVDAWRYGVPQHRQRLVLVAIHDGPRFEWPPHHQAITLAEAIGDLPRLRGGTGDAELRYGGAKTTFQIRARRHMADRAEVVWDHVTRPVREDDRRAFNLMKPGTRYTELPKSLRRYRDDIFDDKYNRLGWKQLSRSITAHIAKDGYWYIHPSEARTLTVREAARIQTFPDHFRFAGTRSHAFEQIGNAVPPALAETVAASVLKATTRPRRSDSQRPRERLAELRSRLLAWSAKDAKTTPWRHPGDPWMVLAGVVLDSRPDALGITRMFLERLPSPKDVTPARIRLMAKHCTARVADRLERLRRAAKLLRSSTGGWGDGTWAKAAALGPANEEFVRVLGLREDGVLISNRALRVAARVTGTPVAEKRRFSEGKILIGSILGTGENVPALNAALTALGTAVCTSQAPTCTDCPLTELCAHPRSGNGRAQLRTARAC